MYVLIRWFSLCISASSSSRETKLEYISVIDMPFFKAREAAAVGASCARILSLELNTLPSIEMAC